MATEWIRVNAGLLTHPKTYEMASWLARQSMFVRWMLDREAIQHQDMLLVIKSDEVILSTVVLGLLRTWCTVNEHGCADGDDAIVRRASLNSISLMSKIPMLGEAMAHVGWAIEIVNNDGNTNVRFPKFMLYNVPADQRRKQKDRERKSAERCGNRADKTWTKRGQSVDVSALQNRTEQNIERVSKDTLLQAACAAPAKQEEKPPKLPKMKKPRTEKQVERDELWEALRTEFYPSGLAPRDESKLGMVVSALRIKQARAPDIPLRAANYRTHYPDCACTIIALMDHWDECREPKRSDRVGRVDAKPGKYDSLPMLRFGLPGTATGHPPVADQAAGP